MRRRERNPARQAQISAHRCLTRDQFEHALSLDVEFVEFDLQLCADGALVVHHDPTLVVGAVSLLLAEATIGQARELAPGLLTYDDALALLAGRRRAHIDLKAAVSSDLDASISAVARAIDVLGADGFIITTGNDHTVKAIRDWGDEHGFELLAGLSLGTNTRGHSVLEQIRIHWSELRPHHRYHHSRASIVVAHHALALLGVARFARRHDLPLVVWTVNTPRALGHWLRPGRAWLVTTNHPDLALRIRGTERLHP